MVGKNIAARQQGCYVTDSDKSVNDRKIILTGLSDKAERKRDTKLLEMISNFSHSPF